MNINEWSHLLHGREYLEELNSKEEAQAKEDGVIIVFGSSDDLLEFRGVIHDELSSYRGRHYKLTNKPSIYNELENKQNFEFNSMQIASMREVISIWCPKNEKGEIWASWEIRTDIPHKTFDIMEDNELFCRGIVFDSKWLTLESL